MRLQTETVARRLHTAEAAVLHDIYNVAVPHWFAFHEEGKDLVRDRARLLMNQWKEYEPQEEA